MKKRAEQLKTQTRRVAVFTLFAPDGSQHKHARSFPYLPANALDSVLTDLVAKWGHGTIAVSKYVAFEQREARPVFQVQQLEGVA